MKLGVVRGSLGEFLVIDHGVYIDFSSEEGDDVDGGLL